MRRIRRSARSTISAGCWRRRVHTTLEIAIDFAIQCAPDHPWVTPAQGLVPLAARRIDALRGKSTEKI